MSCHRSHGGGRRPRCPALPRRAEIVVPDDERAAIVQDGDDVELCIAFPTHGDKYQGHKVAWLKEEGPSYDNTSRSVIEAAFLGHDTGRAAVGVRPVPGWDEPLRFIVVRVKPAVCASILGDGGERHIEKARAPQPPSTSLPPRASLRPSPLEWGAPGAAIHMRASPRVCPATVVCAPQEITYWRTVPRGENTDAAGDVTAYAVICRVDEFPPVLFGDVDRGITLFDPACTVGQVAPGLAVHGYFNNLRMVDIDKPSFALRAAREITADCNGVLLANGASLRMVGTPTATGAGKDRKGAMHGPSNLHVKFWLVKSGGETDVAAFADCLLLCRALCPDDVRMTLVTDPASQVQRAVARPVWKVDAALPREKRVGDEVTIKWIIPAADGAVVAGNAAWVETRKDARVTLGPRAVVAYRVGGPDAGGGFGKFNMRAALSTARRKQYRDDPLVHLRKYRDEGKYRALITALTTTAAGRAEPLWRKEELCEVVLSRVANNRETFDLTTDLPNIATVAAPHPLLTKHVCRKGCPTRSAFCRWIASAAEARNEAAHKRRLRQALGDDADDADGPPRSRARLEPPSSSPYEALFRDSYHESYAAAARSPSADPYHTPYSAPLGAVPPVFSMGGGGSAALDAAVAEAAAAPPAHGSDVDMVRGASAPAGRANATVAVPPAGAPLCGGWNAPRDSQGVVANIAIDKRPLAVALANVVHTQATHGTPITFAHLENAVGDELWNGANADRLIDFFIARGLARKMGEPEQSNEAVVFLAVPDPAFV